MLLLVLLSTLSACSTHSRFSSHVNTFFFSKISGIASMSAGRMQVHICYERECKFATSRPILSSEKRTNVNTNSLCSISIIIISKIINTYTKPYSQITRRPCMAMGMCAHEIYTIALRLLVRLPESGQRN